MKKILLAALLLICTWTAQAQNPVPFWVENFENTCPAGCGANSYIGPNGAWAVTALAGNIGDLPNEWYISCTESGYTPGGCASACPGTGDGVVILPTGGSLHLGGNIGAPGDVGAAYYNGSGIPGFLDASTELRAESPTIDCSGKADVNVSFTFIEGGDAAIDNATLWYYDGSTWSQLTDMPKTQCCTGACDGINPATWGLFNIQLPASADNNPDVKIAFVWVNDNDASGSDPSFAVDNLNLYEAIPQSTNTILVGAFTSTKICQNAPFTIDFTATGTFGAGNQFIAVISDANGVFSLNPTPIGSLTSVALSGTITCTIPSSITPSIGYKIKVIGSIPAVDSQNTTSAFEVQGNPLASISPSGPIVLCSGQSVTLTASAGDVYLWTPGGETTASIQATTGGVYNVKVTQANLCFSTSPDVTINLINNSAPIVSASDNLEFCAGGTLELSTATADSYLWSNGETTQAIIVDQSGDYSVTVTNANGCSNTSALTVVVVNPLPAQPIVTPAGPIDLCSPSTVILTSSYATGNLWSNNETTDSIVVSTGGTYSVTHTDANGCKNTSDDVVVTVNVGPVAAITTSTGDNILCTGSTMTLTSAESTGNAWSTSATTPSIGITTGGTYNLTVSFPNGCSASTSISITESSCSIPTTQLRTIDCGNLNFNLQSSIVADQVIGATEYEFEIKDAADATVIATVLQLTRTLAIPNVVPALNWGTNYVVRVRVRIGTQIGAYGSPCTIGFITDPNVQAPPTSQLTATYCNANNLTLTGIILAVATTGATQYEFRFSQNGNVIAAYTQTSNQLNLASVAPALNWANTYQVDVRLSFGATIEGFGPVCNITFIADPASGISTTQLVSANCGRLNFPVNGAIGANPVPSATQYEFEFTQGGLPYATRISNNRFCGFNVISPALQAGQQYGVRVRAIISGVVGTFGNICTIGLASGARFDFGANSTAEDFELQDGEVLPAEIVLGNDENLNIRFMPNPFTDNVTLSINNTASGAYNLSVYNVEGKLVQFHNNLNQNTISLGNNLENGLYIIELRGENGWIQRERLVKTNH
jgi:hypothetical protein